MFQVDVRQIREWSVRQATTECNLSIMDSLGTSSQSLHLRPITECYLQTWEAEAEESL